MAYYEDIFEDNGKLTCVLCSVVLPDDSLLIEAHINEDNHKKLYLNRLLIRNGMELSGNFLKCSICNNKKVEFNSIDHINQDLHSELMKKIRRIVDKDGAFLNLPENESEKRLNCLICNREVAFTLEGIESHVSDLKHKRARAITLQPFNGLISVEDHEGDLWCKICKMFIPNFVESIFEHVDYDKDHVTALTKLLTQIKGQNVTIEKFLVDAKEDKALCNKCNKEVSCNIDNLERHIRSCSKTKPKCP